MPTLDNPKHERFARVIAQGLGDERYSQGRAYVAAGYQPSNQNSADACASRLLRKFKPVLDRVKELQAQAARRAIVTVESIVDELEEARTIARASEQAGAMVQASATKAKVLGLTVDRHEHGTPGSFEQSTSTADMADAIVKERNPSIAHVSEAMRESVLAELARHDAALDALAHGDRLSLTQ